MNVTMGSLFSGFGGFEIPAMWHGAKVLWQSEIEPWAVELLKKRFPDAVQLGDVTRINGAEIPPVDIITFGSPCQDMSVAGARKGMKYICGECGAEFDIQSGMKSCPECGADVQKTRSGLFTEAVRIIREMRSATNGEYPKYIIWENVPGAFTSNKGADFRAVLEEITETEIPMPASGKWANTGMVRGGKCDVSWRVMDAQYWGVAQRRKRVYLVGDYRAGRSAEVLFKPEGVSRHIEPSRETRKRLAAYIKESVGETSGITDCEPVIAFQGQASDNAELSISDKISPTIQCTKQVDAAVPIYSIDRAAFNQGINAKYDFDINDSGISQTLLASGANAVGLPVHIEEENITYIVRRLTPSECSKLQAFPAYWHKGVINAKGKEMPDTAAYKGYGNAVATVCAEYPLANIIEILKEEHPNV